MFELHMFRQAKRNHAREEVATAPGPFSKLKKGIALREEIKVPPRDGTQGEREGIPVAHHLSYEGHFLYDNPRNGITIVLLVPLEHSLIQVVGITDSSAYVESASNVIPLASPPCSVFIRAPSSSFLLVPHSGHPHRQDL
ncbi:hypothetical protein AHAS_Ahas18G0120600 [Arachis hypogaea]